MKIDTIKTLQSKQSSILESWMKNQLSNDTLKNELISNEEQREISEELLNSFLDSLDESSVANPASKKFSKVNEQINSIAVGRAKQGFTPRETAVYLLTLREAILKVMSEIISNPVSLYHDSVQINNLLDNFSILSFESYNKSREEIILRQTDEITEISTPVIQVWDGILVLPIIGTLDSSRTQVVMENLLQQIVDTGSTIAILDISGVPAVDSLVAQHLIKTVSATRLMGAECIISGIRPEIAQTVVHLGIDLSSIVTKASLASALKFAFSMLRMNVIKQNS
jgi:rsbT co-antagonist protein RsbR